MHAKQILVEFLAGEGMSEAVASASLADLVSDDTDLTPDQAQAMRQWLNDNRAECVRNIGIGFNQAKAQHLEQERKRRLKKNRSRRR